MASDNTNEPTNGEVLGTDWISQEELIVEVEDSEGRVWKESYTFNSRWRDD